MKHNGTTSSGAVGVPSYTERTYESRLRRAQIAVIENPPEDATAKFYREAYERDQARLKRWADEDRAKQEKIRAEDKEQRERQRRELEKRTFDRLLSAMFEQHGASDGEKVRVRRVVEQHSPEQRTLELYEVTLLKLRAALEGTETGQRWDAKLKALPRQQD
jgi:hypothetical protein